MERPVGILADLQGPKIRLGRFAEGSAVWANGETVVITSEVVEGTHDRVSCTYKRLPEEVKQGDRLLIDDGRVAVEVVSTDGIDIVCRVTEAGRFPTSIRCPTSRSAFRHCPKRTP